MPGLETTAPPATCPACTGTQVRTGPPSRKTGFVVASCAACKCHFLSNPAPPHEIAEIYDFDRDEYASFADVKRQATLEQAYGQTLDRLSQLIQSGDRELFDVGAGAGEFLQRARQHGFEPHGNEIAPGAIELAKEFTGIDLYSGSLAAIEGSNLYDAVTMWCVLAHVSDPDELLTDALRLLKPGGVLFLQTPRWSSMDAAGLATARVSGGRMARVLDRRVNGSHMVLNSQHGLTTEVSRLGFDVIDVGARARYSLQTHAYLRSLGVPTRLGKAVARGLDIAVDRNLFFRNVLDLYARKPLT